MVEIARTNLSLAFAGQHEYFEFGAHPHAQAVSAYDGQVEFTAMPKSVVDFNSQAIFAEVRGLAEACGLVRMLA